MSGSMASMETLPYLPLVLDSLPCFLPDSEIEAGEEGGGGGRGEEGGGGAGV